MGRGFIRNTRKVTRASTAIFDESEDEYGVDELDAFADTTDEIDAIEMGLRIKSVPPMAPLNSSDAEPGRKHVQEEKDTVQKEESEVAEHEIVDLVSEDELNIWKVDESNVVVFKREDTSSTSNLRSPSIQAESETLRRSPRKKNRVTSASDDLPCLDQPQTDYKIPGELNHSYFSKMHVIEDIIKLSKINHHDDHNKYRNRHET